MGYRYNPATGKLSKELAQPVESGPALLPAGVNSDQQINMIDSTGTPRLVPAEQVRDAIEQGGYQLEGTQARKDRVDEEDYGDADVRTFAESAASGLSFGISDLVLSKFDKEGLAARRRVNDNSALAGEIVGSTAALLIPGTGVAKAAKIAEGLGARAAKNLGAEAIERSVGLATRGAFEGAAMGVQQAVSEKALGNPEQFGELLYSKMGMNALAGAIGSPLLDLGFAGLGKVAAKAADAATPFIPGATQAIDPITMLPLEGARAAIARRVNDATATISQMNPFNKVPKDVLEMALNNPEGRRLLATPEIRAEVSQFMRAAPSILNDFKKDVTSANAEVRQSLKSLVDLSKADVEQGSEKVAQKLFGVHESIAKAQKEAQEKFAETLTSKTGKPRGVLLKAEKYLTKTADDIGNISGVGGAYKVELENAYKNAFPEIYDDVVGFAKAKGVLNNVYNEGSEIAALRTMKQTIGQQAKFGQMLETLSIQDRAAVRNFRNLYKDLDGILKDPKMVGKDLAELITQADSDYSKFKGLQGVFRDLTQKKTVTDTGKFYTDRADKAVKKILNSEDNIRLQSVLGKVKDISADAPLIATELKRIGNIKGNPAELNAEIATFMKSPAAKDPQLLYDFAIKKLGVGNEATEKLSTLGSIKSNIDTMDGASKTDKVLEIKKSLGEMTPDEAQRMESLTKMSRAYGNWESPVTGQQGALGTLQAVTALGAGMAAGPVGVLGVLGALPVTNTLAYTRILDGIVKAGDLQRNELVSSVVGAIKSLGTKSLEQTIRIKSVPKMDYKEMYKEVEKSRDSMQGMQENPMFTYIPEDVITPLMDTHMRATQFLSDKLPKPPRQSPSMFNIQKDWKPTDGEKQRFELYFDAVKNPVQVVKDLASGQVSREQVEALKNVYPQMYEQIGVAISSVMNNEDFTKKVPYEKRLQMSIFFETAADISMQPEYILGQQMTYQGQEKEAQPTQTGLNKLKSVAKNSMSEMQRLQS